MKSFKEIVYTFLPYFLQNTLIAIYNLNQNRVRHSGNYNKYKHAFQESRRLNLEELKIKQKDLLVTFLLFAKKNLRTIIEF